MRIALIIAILFLGLIGAHSQDYHFSPGDYPIEIEIVQEWRPEPSGLTYGEALPTFWEKNKKGFAITGILMTSIILDATGDAVYDMGKESGNSSQMAWGHTLQAGAIGVGVLTLPMINWKQPMADGVRLAVSWVAMRYAIFDLSYNLTRGIDPLYADGFKAQMEPFGRVFTQTIFLGFSLALNFGDF